MTETLVLDLLPEERTCSSTKQQKLTNTYLQEPEECVCLYDWILTLLDQRKMEHKVEKVEALYEALAYDTGCQYPWRLY